MRLQLAYRNNMRSRLSVFGYAQLHLRYQTTKILIASAAMDQYRQDKRIRKVGLLTLNFELWTLDVYLSADMSFNPIFLGREMKSRCTINAITIHQRHG